jgi:hypothetical protein
MAPNPTWLYLDSPAMRGPAVRRWQEILTALNYDIGSWGVDGCFGRDVDTATRKFQQDAGLDVDGVVGADTLEAAEKKFQQGTVTRPTIDGVSPTVVDGVEVWDYRAVAKPPKNFSYIRPWSQISGIMLHRTACVLGENPTRYLPVNAHVGLTMGGRIVLAHAWDKMIWHGHAPSPWTIGVEIDGNPEGKPGYFWTPGGGPHDVTDAQVKAADVLLKLFREEFTRQGQEIKYLVAHRQSSKDRECDPGWLAWNKIAVPWMNTTGAIPGPREGHPPTAGLALPVGYAGDTWGDGFQVPHEWDTRSTVPFWKQ